MQEDVPRSIQASKQQGKSKIRRAWAFTLVLASLFGSLLAEKPLVELLFNEAGGGTAQNTGSLGAQANGTLNGPTFTKDVPLCGGTSIQFDGIGDFVRFPAALDYGGDQATVEAWIKPGAVDGLRVIWDDDGVDADPGLSLAIRDGQLQFKVSTSPGGVTSLTAGIVAIDQWQHVAGWYDGSELRVFIDGVESGDTRATSGDIVGNNPDNRPAIGADNNNTAASNFTGKLDSFRVFQRALEPKELAGGHFLTGFNACDKMVVRDRIDLLTGPSMVYAALTPPMGDRLLVVRRENAQLVPGLSIVDLDTGAIRTEPLSGEGIPFHIAVSQDGTRAYVAVSSVTGNIVTEGPNRIDCIDLPAEFDDPVRVMGLALEGVGMTGVAVNSSGTRVYATDRSVDFNRLDIIDANTCSLINSVSTREDDATYRIPDDLVVSPDNEDLYVVHRSNSAGNVTVTAIDTEKAETMDQFSEYGQAIPTSLLSSVNVSNIVISGDRKRAYVSSEADCRISVLDTHPESPTFNQEIDLITTTATRLAGMALSPDNRTLFTAALGTQELLVIDTESKIVGQKIPVRSPLGVVAGLAPALGADAGFSHGLAFASDRPRNIAIINLGSGPFVGGDPLEDAECLDSECGKIEKDEVPDPGKDSAIVVRETFDSIFEVFSLLRTNEECTVQRSIGNPDQFIVKCAATVAASARTTPGVWEWARNQLRRALEIDDAPSHIITIDSRDVRMRPKSLLLEDVMEDGQVRERTLEAVDEDENGIIEAARVDGFAFLPPLTGSPLMFDINEDGMMDFLALPYEISGGEINKAFIPMTDTNGDGINDSVAFDLDGDGEPDPDKTLWPFVAGPPNPEVELKLHFAQFGDGLAGDSSISSQITLFNLDPETPATVKVILRDDEGNPLSVDLNGELVSGEKDLVIPAGGLSILRTDGVGDLVVGSVIVCSDRALAGVILFGGSAGLAGVGESPIRTKRGFVASLQSNSADFVNTGIAVMNLETEENTLFLALCDATGTVLARAELALPPMGHRAVFLDRIDWIPLEGIELDFSEFEGLLKVTALGKHAATVIQTQPNELITLPVAPNLNPNAAPAPAPSGTGGVTADLNQKLYFAQFANGSAGSAQVQSQIVLFNLSSQDANSQILIKDGSGNPLTVSLNGQMVEGQADQIIPAGALQILSTDGLGSLQTGSVRVSSDRAVAGVILFSGTAGAAGVGSSPDVLRGFEAPVEVILADEISTGVAVMNLATSPQTLSLTLVDAQGMELATFDLSLEAMGHRAVFVDRIDWQEREGVALDFSNFAGLLKVRVEEKAAATVIRTQPSVFATQPVVNSLN